MQRAFSHLRPAWAHTCGCKSRRERVTVSEVASMRRLRDSGRQLCAGETIKAYALLSGHKRKIAMNRWWYANAERTAIAFFSQCNGNGFAIQLHIGHHFPHHLLDAFERGIRCFCQPAQGGEFGA